MLRVLITVNRGVGLVLISCNRGEGFSSGID